MKRFLAIILLLALSAALLCGCSGENGTESGSDTDYSFADNSGISGVPKPDHKPGEEPNPEPQPEKAIDDPERIKEFFEANTKPGEAKAVPDHAERTDTDFLYKLPFEIPSGEGCQLSVNGDLIQAVYYAGRRTISRIYSFSSGRLIIEFDMPEMFKLGLLDNGGFWVLDEDTMVLSFYGSEGRGNSFSIPESPGTLNAAKVSGSGKYLAMSYVGNNDFRLYDLETLEKRESPIESNRPVYDIAEENGLFTLLSDKNEFMVFDPEDGEIQSFKAPTIVGEMFGSTYTQYIENAIFFGAVQSGEFYYSELGKNEYLSRIKNGFAVTNQSDENTVLRIYDLAQSKKLAELSFDSANTVIPEFASDGRLFICIGKGKKAQLYYFDSAAALKAGKDEEISGISATLEELKAETDKIASALESDTEIDLLYASEGNDFVIYDYIGAAEIDPFTVYHSVKKVDSILRKYPKGMLKETYSETHSGLKIYLCSTIYGINGGALGTAGGVTTEADGYIIIAVDVKNNLDHDIPHELSHVFDRRIGYVGTIGETDWLAKWEEFTPMSDAYTYTYENYYENYEYTGNYESDKSDVWFVDDYARTFPTEDRARIIEYLFNSDTQLHEMLNYPHLTEKARLYSEILKECFPSCKAAASLTWEKYL